MIWIQRDLRLPPRRRGFHLVTPEVVGRLPELKTLQVGLLHVFIQHTSASLTINENADPDVRVDMESAFNVIAPEGAACYTHTLEGPDDMPAHIKSSLLDSGITIPIRNGALRLGTWQGIYLCEHRNHGGARTLVLTLMGEDR